jgi:hypothetical protein
MPFSSPLLSPPEKRPPFLMCDITLQFIGPNPNKFAAYWIYINLQLIEHIINYYYRYRYGWNQTNKL